MRYLLFAFLAFCLPHVTWIPLRLGVDPELLPLGIQNVVLVVAALLWVFGKATGSGHRNPFLAYNVFFVISVLWVGAALVTFLPSDGFRAVMTPAKQEITLLALYFVPLAVIRDERDLKVFAVILLGVHLLVGIEVLRSGVLAGSNFNDNKRGSGPFGVGFTGSDVGGAYLAQVLMFFLAVALSPAWSTLVRVGAGGGGAILFLGILATYSRGSLLAAAFGFALMMALTRFRLRTAMLGLLVAGLALYALPESTWTRFNSTVDEEGTLDEGSQGRLVIYQAGWDSFKSHPFGAGTGQCRLAMREHLWEGAAVDTHNGFLYALVQYGIVGLFAFLWMLGSILASAHRIQRDPDVSPTMRTYALGVMGFLGALVACNFFYANFYKDLVLGTVALHLGMMAWVRAEVDAAEEEEFADESDTLEDLDGAAAY